MIFFCENTMSQAVQIAGNYTKHIFLSNFPSHFEIAVNKGIWMLFYLL